MYLFTRQAQLALGKQVPGMDWAVAITEKVNQITSLDVGLWTPVLSPGLGRLSWGSAVESLGDLEDADAKLMADPMYLDALERGAEFLTGTADDRVGQFLENPDAPANTSHVAVVQSQLANGAFARGVATGIEIAKRATAIGGIPTSFLLATTGTYAGCVWITSGTSIRELEQGEQAVNSDPGFIELIDREAATCFVEGITTQEIWRRIV